MRNRTNGFNRGHVYRFRKDGRWVKKDFYVRCIDYSFAKKVDGYYTDLYMFVSVNGKWRETFTREQLKDYHIEEVA
jgi:hypothetical protein